MSRYEDEVYKFAKKPGYNNISTGDQIRKISYASKVELNNMVQPRIRQNAMERTASMSSAQANVGSFCFIDHISTL